MINQKKNILKLCSFYVSDWHIITMILPYINNKMENGSKIVPILEQSIEKNVETLLNKLNLKNHNKILNINWKETKEIKNLKIENILNGEEEEVIIIINGKKEYIETVNKNIEKYIEKNDINKKVKIVDFYEITQFNGSVKQILNSHDKILNTSGEKEIVEIFKDYKKEESKET